MKSTESQETLIEFLNGDQQAEEIPDTYEEKNTYDVAYTWMKLIIILL